MRVSLIPPQLIYLAQDMSKYQLSSINKYHKLQCLNYPFSQSCPSNIVFSSTGRYNSCSTSLHMCAQSVQLCIFFQSFPYVQRQISANFKICICKSVFLPIWALTPSPGQVASFQQSNCFQQASPVEVLILSAQLVVVRLSQFLPYSLHNRRV